jgi:hypothetical protein
MFGILLLCRGKGAHPRPQEHQLRRANVFSAVVSRAKARGEHLIGGNITAASWISRTCSMSVTSAADRLCVGEQLQSLPKIADALSSGEIGYQSASVLCHLRDQLGEKRDLFDEEEMLDYGRRFSVTCACSAESRATLPTPTASSMKRSRTTCAAASTSA